MGSPLLFPPAGNGLNSIFKAPLQLGRTTSQEVLTPKLHDPLLSHLVARLMQRMQEMDAESEMHYRELLRSLKWNRGFRWC